MMASIPKSASSRNSPCLRPSSIQAINRLLFFFSRALRRLITSGYRSRSIKKSLLVLLKVLKYNSYSLRIISSMSFEFLIISFASAAMVSWLYLIASRIRFSLSVNNSYIVRFETEIKEAMSSIFTSFIPCLRNKLSAAEIIFCFTSSLLFSSLLFFTMQRYAENFFLQKSFLFNSWQNVPLLRFFRNYTTKRHAIIIIACLFVFFYSF